MIDIIGILGLADGALKYYVKVKKIVSRKKLDKYFQDEEKYAQNTTITSFINSYYTKDSFGNFRKFNLVLNGKRYQTTIIQLKNLKPGEIRLTEKNNYFELKKIPCSIPRSIKTN